jgi:hypothetical protein
VKKIFFLVVIFLVLVLGCAHLSGDNARPKTLNDEQLKAWWMFSLWSGAVFGSDEGRFYRAELEDRGYCHKAFRGWSKDCENK